MTTNVCKCPKPPGGEVHCEEDQGAFCWVDQSGEMKAGCVTLNHLDAKATALAIQTRDERHARRSVLSALESQPYELRPPDDYLRGRWEFDWGNQRISASIYWREKQVLRFVSPPLQILLGKL
jgi:hypothetical protein